MNKAIRAGLAGAALVLAGVAVSASAFEVHQLTDEGSNQYPCLNRGVVCWIRTHSIEGDELYVCNVAGPYRRIVKLTDNGGEKWHPSNHGSEKIVWQGRHSSSYYDWEIFVYNKYSIPRYAPFTDNDVPDIYPVLAGAGHFAWLQGYIMYEAVHYWNESLHSESVLSHGCCPTDRYYSERPTADHYAVAWRACDRTGGEGCRAYLQKGGLHDITDDIEGNMTGDYSLFRGTLAYEYGGGGDTRIKYWDGTEVHDIGPGFAPSLYNGTIAYEVWTSGNWEIFYWNGTESIRITDNDYVDMDPSLHGDMIAWWGRPDIGDQIFYAKNLMETEPDPAGRSIHGSGFDEHAAHLEKGPGVPAAEWLGTPVPMPFRGMTSLEFALPRPEMVRLRVYDVAGRIVRTLVDEARPAGRHTAVWNARSDGGAAVVPGVYFLRFEAGDLQANRKIVVRGSP